MNAGTKNDSLGKKPLKFNLRTLKPELLSVKKCGFMSRLNPCLFNFRPQSLSHYEVGMEHN